MYCKTVYIIYDTSLNFWRTKASVFSAGGGQKCPRNKNKLMLICITASYSGSPGGDDSRRQQRRRQYTALRNHGILILLQRDEIESRTRRSAVVGRRGVQAGRVQAAEQPQQKREAGDRGETFFDFPKRASIHLLPAGAPKIEAKTVKNRYDGVLASAHVSSDVT